MVFSPQSEPVCQRTVSPGYSMTDHPSPYPIRSGHRVTRAGSHAAPSPGSRTWMESRCSAKAAGRPSRRMAPTTNAA